ncbi:MAG: hypothetical protein AAFO95_13760, partial [Cyanobacteria bacterium J06600_6]
MAIATGKEFFNPNPQDLEQGNYSIFESGCQDEILDWFKQADVTDTEKDRLVQSLINFDDR